MMTCVLCPHITKYTHHLGSVFISALTCSTHNSVIMFQSSHLFLPSSLHPVKHSFTNYNVPPRLSSFLSCISALLRPVLLRLSLVTQAVGTCAPSWTAPCRMSVTCIYWWRRRRSRLCGEPSWKKGGATVHLLTCCSLWWWGTLTLNNKIFCFFAI